LALIATLRDFLGGSQTAPRLALIATLRDFAELLRRLNAALAGDLPRPLRHWPQRLAADLVLNSRSAAKGKAMFNAIANIGDFLSNLYSGLRISLIFLTDQLLAERVCPVAHQFSRREVSQAQVDDSFFSA
jgi:hypothetical protein